MKKRTVIVGAIVLFFSTSLLFQSCNKIKDLVAFDVNKPLPTQKFEIDSASASAKGDILLFESSFYINLDSILAANDISAAKISNSKFKKILLSIVNPSATRQFGFASHLSVKLSTNDQFDNAELIASASNIKPGDSTITFKMENIALDKYIEQSTFYYRLYGSIISPVPVTKLAVEMQSAVQFTVKPLK